MKRGRGPIAWRALPLLACAVGALCLAHGAARAAGPRHDMLYWEQEDRRLQMRDGAQGVVVDLAQPAPIAGLRAGDVVQRVGEVRVTTLASLLDILRTQRGHSIVLTVRRGNAARVLRLAADDYADWIPPHPPPPPAPPPPAK